MTYCMNFGCTNEAEKGWPCCDTYCGYQHRGNLGQIRKYKKGIIGEKDLREGELGLRPWSQEKTEYYLKLTEGE